MERAPRCHVTGARRFALWSTWEGPPPPSWLLLRGLGRGVVLARGAIALARASGRCREAVAVASRVGAGEGGAAALRLAPPGVAGRDGRVTCPGAERLRRRVSGAGSGEPAGRVQIAAGRLGLAAWGAGGRRTVHFVRSSILPCQRPSPGPSAAQTSDAAACIAVTSPRAGGASELRYQIENGLPKAQ